MNNKGLAWTYIKPEQVGNSDLIASNIAASQEGLASSLNSINKLKSIQPTMERQQSIAPNPYMRNNDTVESPNTGLVNKNIPNPTKAVATSGNGLVKPSLEAAKPYMNIIQEASKAYNIPSDVLLAVAQTESGFNPNAVSPTGVKGLMQVTQNTYKNLGFTGDRADPVNSVNAGAKLLSQLYNKYGNWDDAFYAYNGGHDAVRGVRENNWGVWANNPNKQKEIQNYSSKVNSYRDGWRS